MNKTFTLITGAIVIILFATLLGFGQIDLLTFGTSVTAVLGVVYGFYQKVENVELNLKIEDEIEFNKDAMSAHNQMSNNLNKQILENKNLHKTIHEWTGKFDKLKEEQELNKQMVKETVTPTIIKSKQTRKPKVK